MSEEGNFWVTIWSVIFGAIVLIFVSVDAFDTKKVTSMAELGYEQTAVYVDGQTHRTWVKAK